MTLFRKVFSQADADSGAPIRNSYDLAMAPDPEGFVEMEALASTLDAEDAPETPDEEPCAPPPDAVAEAQAQLAKAQASEPTPPPVSSGSGRRNKTRLLGFNPAIDEALDPIAGGAPSAASADRTHPVGWVAITDGAGVGHTFPLYSGVASVGRGEDQMIALDFGDTSISRQNHAAIAYDPEQAKFFVGHGGKSNIIRHNDQPVLSTVEIKHGDMLRIGETTLRLVALCDDTFQWDGAGA